MRDQEIQSSKEAKRVEKRKAEEVELLAKDQVRKKAYLAREQEIENGQKAEAAERGENHANEEIKELAREKARKEAYVAREKAIAQDQEARKLKAKKQPSQ